MLLTAQVLQGRFRDSKSISGVIDGGDVDRFGRLIALRIS
jgi:hypothetical protein